MKTAVYFDEYYFKTLKKAHELALPFLQQVIDLFPNLGIGEINLEILEQIAAKNYSKIAESYEAIIASDLKKLGIKKEDIK